MIGILIAENHRALWHGSKENGGSTSHPSWLRKVALGLGILHLGLAVLHAAPGRYEHPDYLIQSWSAVEGVSENSALAVAQTPDGYLWVGSSSGLLRFNAFEFERVARSSGLKELDTVVQSLNVDRSGRLWVSTKSGLALLENGKWRLIGGENVSVRTVAESPRGEVFLGTFEGRLLQVNHDVLLSVTNGPALAPSGVFLIPDAKQDKLWLANRRFVGQWTESGWKPVGPQPSPSGSLVAAPARGGGLWVHFEGQLWHYKVDGQTRNWKAPSIDQPWDLLEDPSGTLWVASAAQGLVRWRPGGAVSFINATNGLGHNAARSIFQDAEENFWVGTSTRGLFRLKPRYFVNVGAADGLADCLVKTLTEENPGRIFAGTHGTGTARIENERVVWSRPAGDGRDVYTWSALHDRQGRLWTGTFNSGLFLEENGVQKPFRLPKELGPSVGALLEDSKGRIWVGASSGLGVIENQVARVWPGSDAFTKVNVRSILEDPREEMLWIGTFGRGLWQVDLKNPGKETHIEGLPRKRITSLAIDNDGCIWAGVFGEGLFCIRDGRPVVQVGRRQGLPASTIGSFLEDGRGCCWLGSDQGILRVSSASLHRVVKGRAPEARFYVFDCADGMDIQECSEGLQPSAIRDSTGRLWFATLRGAVRLDPTRVRLNKRPPPVVIERFNFRDRSGTNHTVLAPTGGELVVPPGSTALEFRYSALSYTAPEKIRYAYYLKGAAGNRVQAGNRRLAAFQVLPPGHYHLRITAANNDGLWNTKGATVAFTVQPFYWQTLWFRILMLAALAAAIGFGVWRVVRARYLSQIERLEQQRALAHERARLAAIMESTSDLVAFADNRGNLLHLNPAGMRMLCLEDGKVPGTLKLGDLFAARAADQLAGECVPTAEQRGTWQGESVLLRRDGQEIPVSQVVIAHRDATGQVGFISVIARDISEEKRAAEERDRLQTQLAGARKLESVGRLAGGVAHDFNNMLQVIIGNAELALQQAPAGSAYRECLLQIRRSAERSAMLTRQLLAFARKQTVIPRILDLNTTVSRMLKTLQSLIGESAQLVWVPAPDLWLVRMDPAQVEQILANLTINARDAMPGEGSVRVETANFAADTGSGKLPPDCPVGEYVTLTVTDTGRGMSAEVLEHVFEPFYSTKGLGQGSTGLGLATVFGIVKQNSGSITVESRPNHGTTFRIFLPRANAPACPGEKAPEALRGGTETVLLVEDEQQILELGCRALQRQGYTVLTASSPQIALEMLPRHSGRIDLLLTDVVMPGMNGKELRQRIEALHPGIKCLYMSGYTADIISRHGVVASGEDFIQKPFSLKVLTDKVRDVLQR